MKYLVLIFAIFLTACIEKETNPSAIPIQIENPYAFATLPGASTGAAFMVIKNNGDADRLINASAPFAEITEIHQNLIDPDDGTMMMRKIKGLDIPAKRSAILKPTGYHVMFIKLREPLTMGINVPLTLTFEKMGDVKINVPVIAPGTKPQ